MHSGWRGRNGDARGRARRPQANPGAARLPGDHAARVELADDGGNIGGIACSYAAYVAQALGHGECDRFGGIGQGREHSKDALAPIRNGGAEGMRQRRDGVEQHVDLGLLLIGEWHTHGLSRRLLSTVCTWLASTVSTRHDAELLSPGTNAVLLNLCRSRIARANK